MRNFKTLRDAGPAWVSFADFFHANAVFWAISTLLGMRLGKTVSPINDLEKVNAAHAG